MRTMDAQRRCPRQTLNEVLAAELECLRADLLAAPDEATGASATGNPATGDSATAANPTTGAQKPRLAPATYADTDPDRIKNLRGIYQQIGAWSKSSAKGQPGYAPLSALCLSGGGIRSATFNLGVLQGLARLGLLGKFDYLSSVSGGGYIASWLRAWMHRSSVTQVVTELAAGAGGTDPLATEPKPVANLREYSNYLTPELGLFSGDTWSAAATILRNLLLNWLVLVPLLGAVIGIPLLFVLVIRTAGVPQEWMQWLLKLAILVEVIASVLVYWARRFAKKPDTPQSYFIARCVVPICLAAGTLSAAAIGLQLPWTQGETDPTRSDWSSLWLFAGLWSIGVPVLGWLIAELLVHFVPRAQQATTGLGVDVKLSQQQMKSETRQVSPGLELFALVASGAVGAALLVGVVAAFLSFLYKHPALYAILVLPLLLAIYLLTRVIFIGITSLNDEHADPQDREAATALRSRISSNDSDREWWSRLSGWILLFMTAWLAITGICLIGCYLPDMIGALFDSAKRHPDAVSYIVKAVVAAAGAISGVIAALTASSSQTSSQPQAPGQSASASAERILAIAGPLFVVSLIMALSWSVKWLAEMTIGPAKLFELDFDSPGSKQPVPWQATLEFVGLLVFLVLVGLVASRIANVNRFSLHGMYRNRLVRAYLGASNCAIGGVEERTPDPFTGFALNDNFPLHRLCARKAAAGGNQVSPAASGGGEGSPRQGFDVQRPLSIINTTLNLVHGEKLAWQQRKAESFSMTPLFCGSWPEGYRRSSEYGGPGGITVGTAVTISGAAANPNMGYSSSAVLGFLMAIFNVRLGAWLGNPNRKGNRTFWHPGPRYAIMPLFAEMFGLTNSNRSYVNLSDGGHFDNLGLYEVVLRRCRQVLVSDAGQDGSFSFEDLGNSIRKIRIDFGINIVFDRIQILPNTKKQNGLCCAIARIRYSDVDSTPKDDDGWLIYIKPTLRGRGEQIPYDIFSYSRESPSFPHESTADQWFSESQFESYRALGSHIMAQITPRWSPSQSLDFDALYGSVEEYMKNKFAAEPATPETGSAAAAGGVIRTTVVNPVTNEAGASVASAAGAALGS